MKIGRNEPCPCGLGRKVKRCCGVDRVRERALLAGEAAAELFDLAWHFPRYRARGEAFERWAATAPDDPTREAIETGVGLLNEAERRRIVEGYAAEQPQAWRSLLDDFGNDVLAEEIVLVGAVVAAVEETKRPFDLALMLLELRGDARADPIVALAYALDAGDLWSVVESAKADELLGAASGRRAERALAGAASQLAMPWHEERLLALCGRLESRLPHPRYGGVRRTRARVRTGTRGSGSRRAGAARAAARLDRALAACRIAVGATQMTS